MSNYILGLLKGMIIGICLASLNSEYWGFPLVIGIFTVIGAVIEIKNTK